MAHSNHKPRQQHSVINVESMNTKLQPLLYLSFTTWEESGLEVKPGEIVLAETIANAFHTVGPSKLYNLML